jgi:hypothetical protein
MRSCGGKASDEIINGGIGDVEGPNSQRFSVAVSADVTDTGSTGGDSITQGAGFSGGGSEHHRGLGGFTHAQPDPDGEELPDGQNIFRRVL